MTKKPQPWYTRFNQPKANPNGTDWRPGKKAHNNSANRTDPSDDTGTFSFSPGAINSSTNQAFGTSPALILLNQFKIFDNPPPIPYAGIRVGEITSYRIWKVIDNDLWSIVAPCKWNPGETIIGDLEAEYNTIFFPIRGGVYSYLTINHLHIDISIDKIGSFPRVEASPGDLSYWGLGSSPGVLVSGLIFGSIKSWGEVVEHETGYRSQFAKIVSFDSSIGEVDLLAMRRKYLPCLTP